MLEGHDRTAEYSRVRRGNFHRSYKAWQVFRQYEYSRCTSYEPIGNTCFGWEPLMRRWEPYYWTGTMLVGNNPIPQPVRDPAYSSPLQPGAAFETQTQDNELIHDGFQILGLGLDSRAGYGSATKLTWKATHECKKNWLYYAPGYNPAQAPVLWAESARCG